jgi:NADH-quinone oxidoreductase subunit A
MLIPNSGQLSGSAFKINNNLGNNDAWSDNNVSFFVLPLNFICFFFSAMTNSAIFLVVLITAVVLVGAALLIALLLAPRSTNPIKGQVYECGIPTRGTSWMQFRVGYYLFAILYLVFDVETVLLFPWASSMRQLGPQGLFGVIFFLVILALGLAYAWRKGALIWK